MTRSRRKTPIVGMTTAESDARFKAAEHRRERAAVKIALNTGADVPDPRLFGDPCKSDKDGKQYCPTAEALRK